MFPEQRERRQTAPNSTWLYLNGFSWVTLLFWGVGYVLAGIQDDPFIFLTLSLPLLFGMSQLLINIALAPSEAASLWRRLSASCGATFFVGSVSIWVIWPIVARIPWGIAWTTQPQAWLAVLATWLAGAVLAYALRIVRPSHA